MLLFYIDDFLCYKNTKIYFYNHRDQDGVQDNVDNCPDIPNSDQLDTDEDRKGMSIFRILHINYS